LGTGCKTKQGRSSIFNDNFEMISFASTSD
jgi:hypothetical protein